MRTLTPEEYKKLYGEAGLKALNSASASQTPQQTQSTEPSYLSRVTDNVGTDINKRVDTVGQILNRPTDIVTKGTQVFGQGAGLAANTLEQTIGQVPIVKDVASVVGKGFDWLSNTSPIKYIGDKLGNSKSLQDLVTTYNSDQNFKDSIDAVANIARLGLDTKGAVDTGASALNTGGKIVNKTIDLGKQAVNNIAEQGKSAYDALSGKLPNITSYPKQFLDKITTDKISPQVKTILQDAPVEKLDRYIADGVKAQSDPRALTPLEKAGETAVSTAKIIKDDLGNLGKQKAATLTSVGDVKVPGVAIEQIDKVKTLLQKNLTKDERGFVNSYIKELEVLGKNPTAKTVDALVDKMQSTFFEKGGLTAIPVTTRIKSLINTSIGEINSKLKSIVDGALGSKDYSILNQQYANKVKLFGALNKSLGAEGARGGSLLKRFFSPQDAGTKKLFSYIKQYYGIDLAQDATLAKFVMETLGDTRAKSLLQLPPMSKSGIIDRALQAVENKLTSPTKVLDKARTIAQKKTTL